jgi:hypothetical protein
MKFVQRLYHYFNQIEKPIVETKCEHCKKSINVKFQFFKTGYFIKRFCNSKCQLLSENFKHEQKLRNLEKYGVESTNAVREIIEKKKSSYKNKTGYDHWLQDPTCREKIKHTNLQKYGVENVFQSEEIKNKIKKTMLERYGVENNMQHPDLFKINSLSRFSIKKYEDTHLYVQSSYEELFVKEFLKKYPPNDLSQDLYIKYFYDNKFRTYHPDFFIKSINTIIEIKSSWTFNENNTNKYLENLNYAKRDACIKNGYNFEFLKSKEEIQSYMEKLDIKQQY